MKSSLCHHLQIIFSIMQINMVSNAGFHFFSPDMNFAKMFYCGFVVSLAN